MDAPVANPSQVALEHRPPRTAARAPDSDAAAGRVSGGIAGVRDFTSADDLANFERGRLATPTQGVDYFFAHGGAAFAGAVVFTEADGAGGVAPSSAFEPATSLLAS